MILRNFRYSRLIRWIFRFRHRCGYGIHSPFAFNFVTGVVYETGTFYAYDALSSLLRKRPSYLRKKDAQFLFRLANYVQPTSGLLIGEHTEDVLSCFRLGCQPTLWFLSTSPTLDLSKTVADGKELELVYVNCLEQLNLLYATLQSRLNDRSVIVVRKIHGSVEVSQFWQQLVADERVRVTFDLYDFGIAFYESRLNKENYIINYF